MPNEVRLQHHRSTSGDQLAERVPVRSVETTSVEAEPEESRANGRVDMVAWDRPLLLARQAGLFVAPANARPEVREYAALVTVASGGRGAVREVCEHMLRCKDAWAGIFERYRS